MPRPRKFTLNTASCLSINPLGEIRERRPVTLPRLIFTAGETDLKEAAQEILTARTIRRGRDAWETITRAESFQAWTDIGKALMVGRNVALGLTGANAPHGRRYSVAFSKWCRQHGFSGMQKGVRSVALELYANIDAITEWRATLPEQQRRRLIHPLSNVRRWRIATQANGKCPQDLKREAKAAWRRFVSCTGLLPPDQAAPLWQTAQIEIAARIASP
jgi:hypothetical protein